jgi:hypothetical protein
MELAENLDACRCLYNQLLQDLNEAKEKGIFPELKPIRFQDAEDDCHADKKTLITTIRSPDPPGYCALGSCGLCCAGQL